MIDWNEVRAVYIQTRSYKITAEKFGINPGTLKKRAQRGGWLSPQHAGQGTNEGTNVPSEDNFGGTDVPSGDNSRGTDVPSGDKIPSNLSPDVPSPVPSHTQMHTGMQDSVPSHTETHTRMHTGMQADVPCIPGSINSLTKLEAARFYHSNLKFAVHALLPPGRGDEGCRGKKPIHKGWRDHTAAEVTPEYLDRHFGPGSDYNLGAVVRAPFVHIDLDSKPDAGASVREWLSNQAHLASVPRERTGGGAHLLFICRDLPKHVAAAKKALTTSITPSVQAELYTDGMNIALSPSVHKSGHRYEWEVTGPIPEVRWSELRHWFAFDEPAEPSRGRPAKERPWWTRFKGSLHSLDAVALFKEAKLLGECIDPDEGKWSVTCPWENQHTKPTPGTSTVIFQNEDTPPGFKCLHAHCSRRSIEDVLCRLDDLNPGIVDRHCKEHRVFTPGRSNADGLPQIPLPGRGRPDSKFASELAEVIGPKHIWFNKGEQLVRISVREFSENDKQIAFHPLESLRVCTEVERYCETGVLETERQSGDTIFVPTSMSRESASKLINSPQFLERIPRIIRILDVQIPVMTEKGDIIIPKRGYDPVLRTWVPDDAPPIHPMPLEEAIRLIREVFKEFRWVNSQGIIHATARLLTPFCKGLCRFNIRTPLWVFHANQSGAGKDYCADVAHIAYTGNKVGDAPLGKDGEEIRKRITTFLNSGRRFVHFANCQFHIEDQTFIGLLTSTTFNARNLGSTNAGSDLTLPNEAEFSISANSGITFREDLTRRMRRIDLHLEAENQNNSEFEREYLHHWIFQNRSLVLSAIGSIVNHWIQAGMPPGPWAFSSFPEWAKTVGGIMHLAGLGNPCQPHITDDLETGGDRMTRAMTAVFKLGFEKCPNDWIEIDELFSLLAADDSDEIVWFGSFSEGEARATRTKVGMFLRKFRGRRLSGILMEIDGSGKKSTRHRFRFSNSPAKLVDTAVLLDEVFGTDSRPPGDSSAPNSPNGPVSYAANSNSCPPCPPCPPPQPAEASGKLNAEKKSSEGTFIFSKAETPSRGGQGGQGGQNHPVTAKGRLPEIAAAIRETGSVALDIETYGTAKNDALNPWRGDIRLLSLKIPNSPPWLIDLQATGYDLGELGSALEAVEVIAHNAKFDLLWLAVKCGIRPKKIFCTLTAARLLSAGTKPGNNLDQCLERYLGVPPGPDHARSDWGGMFLTDDQLRYAVRDVAHLHDLAAKLDLILGGDELDAVRDLEFSLIPVVVAMEAAGMSVDTDLLRSIRDHGKAIARSASDEIRAALSMPMLNVASPEQLREALKRSGIDLPNTNEETLKASKDEAIIPKILAFRSAEKSAQQAESLLDCVESDNRIHGRFEPTGTETGRFASKSPNLQNIGRGELRTCFVAPAGRRLVVADYSQIELRAAAVIAREEKMIDAYKRGDDLHKLTASTVLGKPLEQVTKQDRQTAKSVAFGLLYGQSAKGLVRYAASSYGVQLADEEAQDIRKAFFRTYGSLRQWHGESHVQAEKGVTEVRTILGRRRLIPDSADEWQRFTALVNTPVQGSCADGMKRALVLIASRLPDSASIISTVHDEVIVECNEADAESVLESVRASMIEAMAEILPRVPIEVEGGICSNWSQK